MRDLYQLLVELGSTTNMVIIILIWAILYIYIYICIYRYITKCWNICYYICICVNLGVDSLLNLTFSEEINFVLLNILVVAPGSNFTFGKIVVTGVDI